MLDALIDNCRDRDPDLRYPRVWGLGRGGGNGNGHDEGRGRRGKDHGRKRRGEAILFENQGEEEDFKVGGMW